MTRPPAPAALALALLAGCGGTPAPAPPVIGPAVSTSLTGPEADEFARLAGGWKVTALVAAGEPVPAEKVETLGLVYTFTDGKLIIYRPERGDSVGRARVFPGTRPSRLEFDVNGRSAAIYKLDGDTLTLCVNVGGTDHPAEFKSQPAGPKTDLLTLRRHTDAMGLPVGGAKGGGK